MKPWLGAAFSIDSRETKPLLLMAIALAMPFLTLVGLDPPESRGRIVAVSCCGGVAIGFVMRLSAS
jgi:hypothetical protein